MRPLETDTDRLAMLRDSGFALTVTIGGQDVTAIFANPSGEAQGVEGTQPSLTCRSVDVSAVAVGDAASIPDAGDYLVARKIPDGTGWTRLTLERE